MKNIQHEITPINEDDLFIILNHPKADFDYPIHFHSDFELNLVLWDFGRRIVGDSIEPFEEVDLVLTGPNVPHKWEGNNVESNHVITIQFHEQLLTFPILQKRMFSSIKDMLEKSKRGIQFTENKNSDIVKRIIAMTQMTGFNVCLEFFALLYDLSTNPRQRILASGTFDNDSILRDSKSRRIAKINEYINNNYISLTKFYMFHFFVFKHNLSSSLPIENISNCQYVPCFVLPLRLKNNFFISDFYIINITKYFP